MKKAIKIISVVLCMASCCACLAMKQQSINDSSNSHSSSADLVVYDPTYDPVSKKLFSPNNRFTAHGQSHTGTENFINFINAFFFPNANKMDLQVRKVDPVDTESMSGNFDITVKGQLTTTKLIRLDNLSKCTCYATGEKGQVLEKTKYIFNLEMQKSLTAGDLKAFNDRMHLYTSRLFNQHYTASEIIPVRALVIIDDAPYAASPILTNNFVMQYAKSNKIINSQIATDKVFSIYVQLSKFVNDQREFIGNTDMQYCMLGNVYNLTNESLNWIKLYCAHRYGEEQEKKRYKIEIDSDSKAYIGAVSLGYTDIAITNHIAAQEEQIRMYDSFLRNAEQRGIQQVRDELQPQIDKQAVEICALRKQLEQQKRGGILMKSTKKKTQKK